MLALGCRSARHEAMAADIMSFHACSTRRTFVAMAISGRPREASVLSVLLKALSNNSVSSLAMSKPCAITPARRGCVCLPAPPVA